MAEEVIVIDSLIRLMDEEMKQTVISMIVRSHPESE